MVLILSHILGMVLATPVTAPAKMGMKVLESIRDEADKELHPSESQIREKLIELEMLLESGRISEQDYEAQEAYLMERWRAIQENKGG